MQFGAIIFYRTFKNYFGQFVWIEKKKSHYNSRVSLHEAPTKNATEKFDMKILALTRNESSTGSLVNSKTTRAANAVKESA